MITNCIYGIPRKADGTPATMANDRFQYSSSTCYTNVDNTFYNPTTTISSSTDIQVFATMSAGEVLTNLLLFCIIVLFIAYFIAAGLSNIKTRKTFIQYSTSEVEQSEVL